MWWRPMNFVINKKKESQRKVPEEDKSYMKTFVVQVF